MESAKPKKPWSMQGNPLKNATYPQNESGTPQKFH